MNKTPKHIALVANTSWSIYNFRISLIRAFIDAGHKVYAIAPRDDYSDKLTASGATFIPLKMENYSTSPTEGLKTFFRLKNIYNKHQFDLIIHYTIKPNIYGSIAAGISGIDSYSVVTGLGKTFQLSGWSQWIVKKLYKLSIYFNKEIWFLNTENRDRFLLEKLVKRNKTFVLPSEGINTHKFVALRGSVAKKIIRFLFAGRLLKDKGILEFVEAAKIIRTKYPRIKFEIVGFTNPKNKDSVTLNDLELWQKKGWINYLGSHEDIRPFIDRCDCVVFPSYYEEGISRILLEASSMSTPIITTDHVGCRDVVVHGLNGILIPPKSSVDLIDALEYYLSLSEEEHLSMGIRGREYVKEQYDDQIVISHYFNRILNVENNKVPYHKF